MSASKWPRIKWNQANARLANAPFENLFSEQERTMSAIQNVIDFAIEKGGFDSECNTAAAELAQLRADLQAAQERSAEQAAQLEQARNNLSVMTNYCEHWLLTGRDMHGTNDLYILNAAIEASRSWLAANPAPEAEQP